MTSRKDWMTTENRTVTLERQMTTRNAWEGHDGLAALNAVPVKEQPQNQLQTHTQKNTPRVFRERGRMRDSHGRIHK